MTSIRSLIVAASFGVLIATSHGLLAADTNATPSTGDNYPLTTCVVSGDKLGEMGDPVKYTYKQPGKPDRLIEFCCKDCIKDFEKDPAKYVAKLDAASTGKTVSAEAKSKPGACCADDMDTASCSSSEGGCPLVKTYIPVAEGLAADNLAQARDAAATLAKQADATGMKAVVQPALAVVHAGDIAAARTAFKTLSSVMAPMAAKTKGYVVMNCPMANADWIQTDTKVRNPYFGKRMLSCGSQKSSTL